MNRDQKGRAAQERVKSVFLRRPETALDTVSGVARIGDGLSCRFTQDDAVLTLDMPETLGGDETGPTPGYFGRAAITGCLAVGIKMAANREGLELRAVDVRIDMDFDNRCLVGIPDTPADPIDTRITVSISSDEPSDKVRALVDAAMQADPWFLCFRDAQRVSTEVSVSEGA